MLSHGLPLPEEILVKIFIQLDIRDILNCSSTSKCIKEVIREDLSIKYKIELHVSGLAPTERVDARMGLCQRLEKLEECLSQSVPDPFSLTQRWRFSDKRVFDLGGMEDSTSLVGGVLARYFRDDTIADVEAEVGRVEVINFYSGPHLNDFQKISWNIVAAFHFIHIVPHEDLFLGLRIYLEGAIQITTLSLSTGDSHNIALDTIIELPSQLSVIYDPEVQVVGPILGTSMHCLPRSGDVGATRVYFVNWTEGIVTHVFTLPGPQGKCQWCLASPETFLSVGLPSESEPYFSLDVYSLQLDDDGSLETTALASPVLLAAFSFPQLASIPTEPYYTVRISPANTQTPLFPDNTNHFRQADNPNARLVSIKYSNSRHAHISLSFISPFSTFANLVPPNDRVDANGGTMAPLVVPWESWGPCNALCIPMTDNPRIFYDDILLDGMQALSEPHGVLDFNRIRVQRHLCHLPLPVSPPQLVHSAITGMVGDAQTIHGEGPFADPVTTRLAYAKGTLVDTLNPDGAPDYYLFKSQYHCGNFIGLYEHISKRTRHIVFYPVRPFEAGAEA